MKISSNTETAWSMQLQLWQGADQWPMEIFETLLRCAPGICKQYDPQLFSPIRGIWNTDAYLTVVSETMYRLRHIYLEKRKHEGRCNGEIYGYAMAIMRSYLESIGHPRGARRRALHQKLRDLLRRDACFALFCPPGAWGLRGWSGTIVRPRAQRDCRARRGRVADAITYLPSERDLKYFVRELLEAHACPVPTPEIFRAAQFHFGVADIVECPWPTHEDPESGAEIAVDVPDTQPGNAAEVKVLVRDAAQNLVERICQKKTRRTP